MQTSPAAVEVRGCIPIALLSSSLRTGRHPICCLHSTPRLLQSLCLLGSIALQKQPPVHDPTSLLFPFNLALQLRKDNSEYIVSKWWFALCGGLGHYSLDMTRVKTLSKIDQKNSLNMPELDLPRKWVFSFSFFLSLLSWHLFFTTWQWWKKREVKEGNKSKRYGMFIWSD